MLWTAAPSRRWLSVGRHDRCPSRVDVSHQFVKLRIAVGVVAFGESEIRQGEVTRAHRLDMDAETAEQRQSLAEGHLHTLAQLEVVVNLLAIFARPQNAGQCEALKVGQPVREPVAMIKNIFYTTCITPMLISDALRRQGDHHD